MVSKRNREGDAPARPRGPFQGPALLIVLAIAVVVLVVLLTFNVTDTANDEGSGGPDAQWDAEPAPIPQLPPAGESLD